MTVLAGAALLGMSLVGCGGSDDDPKPAVNESTSAAAPESEIAAPDSPEPTESASVSESDGASEEASDVPGGESPGAEGGGETSAASGGNGETGTSIKAGVSDHFPDKVGDWKIRRAAGTVSWYKGNDLGYRVAAGPEVSAPAKEQADEILKKDQVEISGGYCGLNSADGPTCYMDIDGTGNFTLSVEHGKPLTDLTEFAEEFTKQVPTN